MMNAHMNFSKQKTLLGLLFFIACNFISCSNRDKSNAGLINPKPLTQVEISTIISNWKKDSLGCLGLRREPERMHLLIQQLGLVGKDSATVIRILGKPNSKYGKASDRHFLYFAECGVGKKSYANYYCHFGMDTVRSFSFTTF